MPWWAWTLIAVYVIGFLLTLYVHLAYLQMVEPPLALLRSVVWPIFVTTGWPHGEQRNMD